MHRKVHALIRPKLKMGVVWANNNLIKGMWMGIIKSNLYR
jgi:hypothetical protein